MRDWSVPTLPATMRKIPRSRASAPGLEWRILKRLPRAAAVGVLLWVALWVFGHLAVDAWAAPPAERAHQMLGYLLWGLAFTLVMAWVTVGIGCVVVTVFKGPRYEADPYPIVDAGQPDRPQRP